jgi:NAD(P)-dependent dehydrogenase (short-subunit alcohol dehydrogenase family)
MSYFAPDLLKGRNAFISGGTSGINLAIAEALADAGATVAVMSRKQVNVDAALARLAAGAERPRAHGYSADVRDFGAVEAALKAFHDATGPIDVVVSGAAGNFLAPAKSISSNGFRTVLEIDLLGSFHVYRAAHAWLRKPGASLISISAPQATEATFGQAHVAAAKAGVDMLTRSLAMEWGPEGIRANCIVPGPIDGTEGMARLAATPAVRRAIERSIPLRRYGSKQEVATMAVFLASDAASYVTGSLMYCDGGQTLAIGYAMSPSAVEDMFKPGA